MSNEIDELDIFLKLAPGKQESTAAQNVEEKEIKLDNGTAEETETIDNNGTIESSEDVAADVAA